MLIHSPMNETMKDEIYAWISVDEGGEGIIAGQNESGDWCPLVTGKRELAMKLELVARQAGTQAGKTIRLVKYSRAEVIKEIKL